MRPVGTSALIGAAIAVAAVAGCADDGNDASDPIDGLHGALDEPTVLLALPADTRPGDVISLRADADGGVEWIERRAGRIVRLAAQSITRPPADPDDVEVVATVDVGTEGEQRGLLGTTVLADGRRFAAWTDPDTLDLVVGELVDGADPRIVWGGTGTAGGAVGGHLDHAGDRLLLGLGQLTDWAQANGGGAIVALDPDGPAEQEPSTLSTGWVNPFAFVVSSTGDAVVADNAVGDDPELIGAGDDTSGTNRFPTGAAPRAPAAAIELPDGRIGICGYLDGEMWAYEVDLPNDTDAADGPADDDAVRRAGTIGPCQTGAAVLDDVVVTVTDSSLLLLPIP